MKLSDRSWFVEEWIAAHTLEDVEEILREQDYTIEGFGSNRVRVHFLNQMREQLAEKEFLKRIGHV